MNKLTEIKQRLNNLNQRGTVGFFALEEFRSLAESDIEHLISLLEEKDKALAFYADERNHDYEEHYDQNVTESKVMEDCGMIARTALNSSNNEGETI